MMQMFQHRMLCKKYQKSTNSQQNKYNQKLVQLYCQQHISKLTAGSDIIFINRDIGICNNEWHIEWRWSQQNHCRWPHNILLLEHSECCMFQTNQDIKSTEYKSRKQLENFVKTEHTTLFWVWAWFNIHKAASYDKHSYFKNKMV